MFNERLNESSEEKGSLTNGVQFCAVLPGWVNYSERQSCARIWGICLYYLINFFCLFFVSLLVLCQFCAHFDLILSSSNSF